MRLSGDPCLTMASYAMGVWLVNQAHGLTGLIAQPSDMASPECEAAIARALTVTMIRHLLLMWCPPCWIWATNP